MNLNQYACCGVREVEHLSHHTSPYKAMVEFARLVYNAQAPVMARFRYAIFTEAQSPGKVVEDRYGSNFAAFITEKKLGEVVSTGYHINPNSHNQLRCWIWTVDHEALKVWARANVPKEQERPQFVTINGAPMDCPQAPPQYPPGVYNGGGGAAMGGAVAGGPNQVYMGPPPPQLLQPEPPHPWVSYIVQPTSYSGTL